MHRDKQMGGRVARPATLSKDPWENFVRFNPVLAWEGLWTVYYSEEGWRSGVRDRRGLEGKDEEMWELDMRVGEDKGNRSEEEEGSAGEKTVREQGQEASEEDIADQVVRLSVAETLKNEEKTEGKESDNNDVGSKDDARKHDGGMGNDEKARAEQQGGEKEEDDEWEIIA